MTTAFLIIVVVFIHSTSSTYIHIYGFGQPSYMCIYLQSHLNVCSPAVIAEATIEKEKEDIIFYIYIYALNSCTPCKREEKAYTHKMLHARTHLSYLRSRTKNGVIALEHYGISCLVASANTWCHRIGP
jgi:hypothetical protein